MAISVVNPVSLAIERTRQILFRPFDLGKWFVLGFCAFLSELGEGGTPSPGGGGGGGGGPGGGGVGGGGGGAGSDQEFREFLGWVQANLGLILVIGGALVLAVV